MKQIEIAILNPASVMDIEKDLMAAARITQHGHEIHTVKDFEELYNKPFTQDAVRSMCALPHPTLQKFGVINVIVVGASRRFLAQITRHQNEVKFMSASLQYSDYSDEAAFAIPYDMLDKPEIKDSYIAACKAAMYGYKGYIAAGIGNDSAGYIMPQSLRNVLMISATPYQWKHMIAQRVCRRNTDETRIVMLKIWAGLYDLLPNIFAPSTTGPFCMTGFCAEGKMSCGDAISATMLPKQILHADYPLLFEEVGTDEN